MKCELRKWRLTDAKALSAVLNNKKVLNNLRDGVPFPYTEQDASDYIYTMLSSDDNSTFAYAITLDDCVIGSIGAFRQGNIHSCTAELGYYLAEVHWGKGIITDAIRQICDIIFKTTDILRIYAEPYPVRRLDQEEIPSALELCWQVFMRYEAPEYSAEGIDAFRASLDDEGRTRRLTFYGAFDNDRLIGVLCMRAPQHIADFFVDEAYHNRGIGRKLFEAMKIDYEEQTFTVNSSPYAVEIYRHLGFVPTDTEQLTGGIRYTPMRFN